MAANPGAARTGGSTSRLEAGPRRAVLATARPEPGTLLSRRPGQLRRRARGRAAQPILDEGAHTLICRKPVVLEPVGKKVAGRYYVAAVSCACVCSSSLMSAAATFCSRCRTDDVPG